MLHINIKGHLRAAREHAREAVTKYGGERDSELLFKAHIDAAHIALTGDHKRYEDYCKSQALKCRDKQWTKELHDISK